MPPFEFPIDLATLARWCAAEVAQGKDYPEFMRAVEQSAIPLLLDGDGDRTGIDEDLLRKMIRAMARSLWHVMPHPAHRYAPAPLPAIGRNDPCFCGSGRKYKSCCAEFERSVPIHGLNTLPLLLDALPRKRWPELVSSHVNPELVADVVAQWIGTEDAPRAMHLLELWFARDEQFVARNERFFDQLLDLYGELGHPRKKLRLIERGEAIGDRKIRSAALQRGAAMLSDKGNSRAAWKAFAEAQRHEPDSLGLPSLEVVMLAAEGREEEARERARYWLQRLRRHPDPDAERIAGMLRTLVAEGAAAFLEQMRPELPAVIELRNALAQAPALEVHYRIRRGKGKEDAIPRVLEPLAPLEHALDEWADLLDALDEAAEEQADQDPEFHFEAGIIALGSLLRRLPMLWNAFEVLDDVQHRLDRLPGPGAATLRGEIIDRGMALLEAVLRENDAMDKPLDWDAHANRAALQLFAARLAPGFG